MTLQRTPLFDWHRDHGGRMVEFGGWEMPVQYSSIVEEHHAVRNAVGLFDISHMGRLRFQGTGSLRLLSQILTCRVDNLVDGQIRYSLICNSEGGILDDVLVNRINSETYGLVVNASNRLKIVDWIKKHAAEFDRHDVVFEDQTQPTAMIAIQGPGALSLAEAVLKVDLKAMRYYTGRPIEFSGSSFVSRTGYTGEDGFELIVPSTSAMKAWEAFMSAGQAMNIKPCGLGCRDTLRLEAAMPLYGHELSESVDPLTAGLGFAVKLDKPEFVGREALLKIKEHPVDSVRVGLKLNSRRIAREHSEVFAGPTRVGEVTSGTFSPTLEQSIAMAYIAKPQATIGNFIEIDIRGKRESAEVVPLPFYKRAT